jgi:hypothetical protein
MSIDLKQECERIQRLGKKGQNASARKELVEALHSKWEGIQVTAARALAHWGDSSSLTSIKLVLIELSIKEARWSSAGAIASALAPHLCEDDIEWVLNFYFSQSKRTNRFALTSLFMYLPSKPTITAIKQFQLTSLVDPRDLKSAMQAITYANSPTSKSALTTQ